MNSLAIQAAKKISTQDARRLLKHSTGLPRNIRNILIKKAQLPKNINELAKMIRNRVYRRKGIEVQQGLRYVPIEQISKTKSIQMARNLIKGQISLNNHRLVSGRNTWYNNTPLNILLSSAPTRISLNF